MLNHSSPLEDISAKEYEQVSIWTNKDLGINVLIAVHSTVLGPALGGCRLYNYSTLNSALYDVLRLSEGMTYKNALAGLPIGGGKSVIMVDPENLKRNRREIFLQFGEWVNSLQGSYITAEDMGTTVSDIKTVQEKTPHVAGTDPNSGGAGDPSPHTALGVFEGMKACSKKVFDTESLSGKKILIQGVGAVGLYLCSHLKREGAEIIVSDVSDDRLNSAIEQFDVKVIDVNQVFSTPCDIFAPCAIGGILTDETSSMIQCKIIAGAANNQLSSIETEKILNQRNIVYAPDFAINAGGVIMCADEIAPGGYNEKRVKERVTKIGTTVAEILEEAEISNKLAVEVAIDKANRIINSHPTKN